MQLKPKTSFILVLYKRAPLYNLLTRLFLRVLPEPGIVVHPPAVHAPLVVVGPQLALPPLDDLPDVPDLDEAAKVPGHQPRQSGGGLEAADEVGVTPV